MLVRLASREIGPGHPIFLIAEAGVNHGGELDRALAMIDAATEAGADAVKFQTFSATRLASPSAPSAAYQRAPSQRELLARLELSRDAHFTLAARCRERGILFLSSPFDEESADLLERLEVAAYKIPSGELTNLPLLAHLARKRRPLLLSTGMARLAEVETAMRCLEREGAESVALLHAVSCYPAAPQQINLRAMHTLAAAFGVPVGYSDHSEGIDIAIAAAALGASLIEKHFTLSRDFPGPDQATSLEPAELSAMIRAIRRVEAALGDGRKRPHPDEAEIAAVARKSLVAATDLPAGSRLTATSCVLQRPGTGLSAEALPFIVGRKLKVRVEAGALLELDHLE